ncbi:LysR substrate-binding domain-containing protein [Geobacter argillaceus]|uniref:Transcriptional regulator, LysR family n=1 Tax=Geobacter argillaceus TaxID=345631 RepID=A0A562VI87_9BACT|nr:LysR substrate-binding domain-containing protein [Geobacter argillaceus]TWJ17580.1 transcriptional regulator, LysR family [Geobacter argillaceus]
MELRHLRYFVAAAEELSFSGAARKLHISQPAISRIIRELECELGVSLFTRERLGLRLTPAGEQFLVSARKIVRDCEEAVHALKYPVNLRQKLVVGFIPTVLGSFLGDALKKFRGNHPRVELSVRDMLPGDQIAALRNREIDLAFVGNPCEELDNEFDILIIQEIPLQAALPATHRLAGEVAIDLKDLERDAFLGLVEGKFPGRNQTISNACIKAGFRPVLTHKASSLVEVVGMIGAGMGVCLMPSDVSSQPHPNVVFVPLNDDIEPVRLATVWLPDNKNPALRYLLECLKD